MSVKQQYCTSFSFYNVLSKLEESGTVKFLYNFHVKNCSYSEKFQAPEKVFLQENTFGH